MADKTSAPAPIKRRRRWPRILLGFVLGIIVLVVAVYFVATSSGFFKGVILPRVGQALNATITVSDASIHPFSEVVLRDLKVQTTGTEPLVTAAEAHARYDLRAILGGNIKVDEVTLSSPVVQIIENADGTSNLDPLTKGKPSKPAEPSAPSKGPSKGPSKPTQVDVNKVILSNGTIRMVKNRKGGGREVTELSQVNLTLTGVKNGQTGKLTLAAGLKRDETAPAPGTNGTLQAKIDGNFDFSLSPDLKPAQIKGQTTVAMTSAGGSMSDLAGLGAKLNCEVTPDSIREIALRFEKSGAALGQLLVSGPFSMEKTEGRLAVELRSIDRQVLNLAGAAQGIDFGSTTINCTNQVDVSNAGKVVAVTGQLAIDRFSIMRTNQTTPPLDLRCVYDLSANQDNKSALLRAFTITGNQKQQPLLRAALASPMSISWGGAATGVPDSALSLQVTNLNLADWKPFLGEAVSAGMANLDVKVQSQQSGKQLVFDAASRLEGLAAKAGSNQITQAGVVFQSRGQIQDMKKVNLDELRLQLTHRGEPALTASLSGVLDHGAETADVQLALNAPLPKLLGLAGQANASASAGTLELKARVTGEKHQNHSVTGTLTLADFTGRFGSQQFQQFGAKIDLDVAAKGNVVELHKVAGALQQGAKPGGSFEVSGNVDTDKKSGQVALKLSDLNENALRPFLEAALGDKKLVSVSLNGSASANFTATGDAAVKADVKIAKLIVSDPKGALPATPLEAGVKLDVSKQKQVADLRQVELTLSPTQRAKNQVQLQGRVDMSQTNAIQGRLKLSADSLDLTPYYDFFAGKAKSASAPAGAKPAPAKTPAPAGPEQATNQEPPAQTLPLRNFPVELNIGQFYLREIAISNWVTAIKIDGGQISINPLQLSLNGAPINGDVNVNLGVPGYQYAINLSGQRIPLEPVANSFVPDKRGMYKGDLLLNAKIQGAGTTGASLQKTLAGQLGFTLTNANVQIVSPKLRQFLQPVAVLLGTPELLDSPLNWVDFQSQMGSGRIDVKGLQLISPMFRMDSAGVMPISEVLTNSPFQNWPVNLYLSRELAERARLAPAGTTQPYVKLPNFLFVAGTLGNPKAQIDKTALAGSLLEKYGNKIPGLNQTTGGLLQGLGGVLSGKSGAPSQPAGSDTNQPPPTTQPPATNKLAPSDLLNIFKKKK